ncbi:MAG: class I SAM-dependent methyltransferase, partial [Magnetospirillum sp.]|nr:class I SAM-dependent methyltransferase [Magnetospirillum sp.]
DSVMNLGDQALSGRFPAAAEVDPMAAPLEMVLCRDCGLLQLRDTVSGDEMYTPNYGYRSGINTTMRAHLEGIAQRVTEVAGLAAGDRVLDIGCNDGTLLRSYPVAGIKRFGIDPLAETFRGFYDADWTVVAGYFGAETWAGASPDGKARAITSIAMFYDLDDPAAFVAVIAGALAADGVWVLEQSYMPTMLERNSFDTICHEHLEYYALAQIERLTAAQGLRVFDVELNDANGGSFRLFVCHRDAPFADNRPQLDALRAREAALALDTLAPYAAFVDRVAAVRAATVAFIEAERAKGKRFHIYGASTKGNTLLQYYGLDRRHFDVAAERNEKKYGLVTPGSRIPIVSEAESRAAKPDYFFVLPWHFRDEVIVRERAFLEGGGKLVFPLPRLEVVGG